MELGVVLRLWISTAEQYGLSTRTAMAENISLCAQMEG